RAPGWRPPSCSAEPKTHASAQGHSGKRDARFLARPVSLAARASASPKLAKLELSSLVGVVNTISDTNSPPPFQRLADVAALQVRQVGGVECPGNRQP